ncbi:MAG: hypothetical protein ABJF11_10905 [Reichenbachiella sp.]|uniref:hypothetical protein n=1 Tax=Reichenbachiella sp. TaxID=2184521 RepID=UPI003264789B
MKQSLTIIFLVFAILTGCKDDSTLPNKYSISGFIGSEDERGASFETKDESGFSVELYQDQQLIEETETPYDGSFEFEEFDSAAYTILVSKEGYAEIYIPLQDMPDNILTINIPSIPLFEIETMTLVAGSFENQVQMSFEIKGFLAGRFEKKYIRLFIHREEEVSSTNYLHTDRLGIPISSDIVEPINDTDARISFDLFLNPYLKDYFSGEKVYFAFYPTSEQDPYVEDEISEKLIYTGLSKKHKVVSYVKP